MTGLDWPHRASQEARPFHTLLALSTSILLPLSLLADQRALSVLTSNYPDAPVTIESASCEVIETYASPTQLPLPDAEMSRSRIQYMNMKGKAPAVYELEGHVRCRNHTRKAVEAVQITTVFLNLFHERLDLESITLRGSLSSRQTGTLSWSSVFNVKTADEVRLAITAVRFSDGTVWKAPNKDLIAWPE